jgi:phosphoglycolate phosphatase
VPTSTSRLVLFDLDGTLLLTHGAGVRSMQRAGEAQWGASFSIHGVMVSGGLDGSLVREALKRSELDDVEHREFRRRYETELEHELRVAARRAEVLPGVHAMLETLRSTGHVTLGLLTGNYAETGTLKLRAVGIEPEWFRVTAWGDEAATRPELVAKTLVRHGVEDPGSTIVVGDTPRDIDCAKKNGCRVLAVATGEHSHEELSAHGADRVVRTLEDPAALEMLIA